MTTKTELADRLARISDDLHAAAGDMDALGQHLHAEQLFSMSSLTSIYGHQLRGRVERDAALAGGEA
jgi:hypothetical protein